MVFKSDRQRRAAFANMKGKWFKGNVYSMPLHEFLETKKYEEGVKKPTALETKKIGKKVYSRYYYKPVQPGENWD